MLEQKEHVKREEAEKLVQDIKKLSPVQQATVKGFLLGMKVKKDNKQ